MPPIEWLVAGLGNPGAEYQGTRHNFGFMAAEALADRCRGRWIITAEPPLAWCRCRLAETGIVVNKPLAFMNRSGAPVAEELQRAGLGPERLIILVDDLALPLGTLRIRQGGGDGGHNGLRSIIEILGTGEFIRIRLGVAPRNGMPAAGQWVDYVLDAFAPEEEDEVRRMTGRAVAAVADIISTGAAAAMSRFNRRNSEH